LSGGGIIVHQDGDFTYGLSCPESIRVDANYILDRTRHIIQKYTDKKVTVDNNDILVDGLKVCGSTVYNKNGLFLILVYFSFNDKTELINTICNKKTDKAPSYIDFMTREELKQEVLSWLRINSI
jgi:lipoate-protein ligase A